EAVRKALRHPEPAAVLRAEHDCRPAAKVRRALPDVDGDVPDLAFDHRDQLPLRVGPLVVQSAQHAPRRARDVALHEGGNTEALQPGEPEGLVEIAALVSQYAWLEHHAARQPGLDDPHAAWRGSERDVVVAEVGVEVGGAGRLLLPARGLATLLLPLRTVLAAKATAAGAAATAATLAATAEHLHLVGDDLGEELLHSVLVGVLVVADLALDVDLRTLAQVL